MRRFLLSFILILALAIPASAHPGGTDSDGGHTDHSTGEYHYHHGYGPHQHEDLDGDGVPDCPYNFEDRTGENSGDSSGSGVTRYPVPTSPPAPTETLQTPPKERHFSTLDAIGFALATLYIGWVAVAFVRVGLAALWEAVTRWFSRNRTVIRAFLIVVVVPGSLAVLCWLSLTKLRDFDFRSWLEAFFTALSPLWLALGFVALKELLPRLFGKWWSTGKRWFSNLPGWYRVTVFILGVVIASGLLTLAAIWLTP